MKKTYILLIALSAVSLLALSLLLSSMYVVPPGHRGVLVTLGRVHPEYKPEGFGLKLPFVSSVKDISVRQQTTQMLAECYSSDLQQLDVQIQVLYRIPQESTVGIYQKYAGDPFDTLIAPRVQEALKEVTALQSAEMVVKKREEIKGKALSSAREKIGEILVIEDIVLVDIALSSELENAIEAKMVQEQEAAKAKFIQTREQIEAETAVIRAKGEAESIRIRGTALKENPAFIDLQIVEKWDGKSPLVVGQGAGGANMLLPLPTSANKAP